MTQSGHVVLLIFTICTHKRFASTTSQFSSNINTNPLCRLFQRNSRLGIFNSIFKRFFFVHFITFYAISLLKSIGNSIPRDCFCQVFLSIFLFPIPTLITIIRFCIFFNHNWCRLWLFFILNLFDNTNTTVFSIRCVIRCWNL